MEDNYMTLVWKEICAYVPNKKSEISRSSHHRFRRILQNVTGVAYPGELITILGSPNSGNTLLLQILAAKVSSQMSLTGQICVNGMEAQAIMTQISGYVDTNERFYEHITIEEHLLFQAKLRMDKRLCNYERKRRVQQVVDEFDLQPFKKFQIKDISKLLKIRLSLASEMLTDPPFLFCENLNVDMNSAETINLVQGLRDIANTGISVICSANRIPTEALDDFDQLLILTEGKLAFSGTPRNAQQFFDSLDFMCPNYFDIVDYFLNICAIHPGREQECRSQIRDICLASANSPFAKDLANRVDLELERDGKSVMAMMRSIKHPSYASKTFSVLSRLFRNYTKNSWLMVSQIFQIMVTGTIIGLCYFGIESQTQNGVQALKGFLFVLVNESIFRAFWCHWRVHSDLQIFFRENKSGLFGTSVFFIAKICFMMLLSTVETFLLVGTSYFIVYYGSISYMIFLMTWLILLFTNLTSHAFAFLFVILVDPCRKTLNFIFNPLHLGLILTTGVFIAIRSILPVILWLRYVSWMFYSYECLSLVFFLDVVNIGVPLQENSIHSLTNFKTGKDVIEDMGFSGSNFGNNLLRIILIYIVFNFLAYVALVIRNKKS